MKPLFIGRFQPMHLGHLRAIEWIINRGGVDRLIIGIGSSNQAFTFRNPLTAGERIEMVTSVLDEVGVKYTICTIPDTGGQASIWFSYVKNYCPRFDMVYSNDPFTRLALTYWNIPALQTPLFDKDNLSGSNIRLMIARGDEGWVNLVPASVRDFLIEINAVERIRVLARIEGVVKA